MCGIMVAQTVVFEIQADPAVASFSVAVVPSVVDERPSRDHDDEDFLPPEGSWLLSQNHPPSHTVRFMLIPSGYRPEEPR